MSEWKEEPQITADRDTGLQPWWRGLVVAAGCAALAGLSIALSCREVGMATLWYANAFGACCLLQSGARGWWATLAAPTGGPPFANGRAAIKLKRRHGFVDKTGNLAINPQFDDAATFADLERRASR